MTSRFMFLVWLPLAAVLVTVGRAQTTVDFPVVQDAWVNENRPTRNYGFQTQMQMRDSA